jgi:exodeoxyribonuclease-3
VRLATWNVNSIRARLDRVTNWLERTGVDVLAMQETKCADEQFPTMPFAAIVQTSQNVPPHRSHRGPPRV